MPFIKIRFDKTIHSHELDASERLDNLFRVSHVTLAPPHHAWKPQMDYHEGSDEIFIIVDLAGVNREDIHLEVRRKSIKISGVRTDPSVDSNTRYHLAEIPAGYFERVLHLHAPVDMNTATARYTDGLLKIHIKKLPIEQTRKISVTKG
jgi:HSP20 family protein